MSVAKSASSWCIEIDRRNSGMQSSITVFNLLSLILDWFPGWRLLAQSLQLAHDLRVTISKIPVTTLNNTNNLWASNLHAGITRYSGHLRYENRQGFSPCKTRAHPPLCKTSSMPTLFQGGTILGFSTPKMTAIYRNTNKYIIFYYCCFTSAFNWWNTRVAFIFKQCNCCNFDKEVAQTIFAAPQISGCQTTPAVADSKQGHCKINQAGNHKGLYVGLNFHNLNYRDKTCGQVVLASAVELVSAVI